MAQTKTIYLMPNPYGQLDAKGRLAGACQMLEDRAPGTDPSNPRLGAELRLVAGSYDDRSDLVGKTRDGGASASPVMPMVYSRSELYFHFTASEPVAVAVSQSAESYYRSRAARNGTPPCVLMCAGADDLQLEALAGERLDAIARFRAAYGADPPVEAWASQFELDADVAEVAKVVEANRKAEAEKAEAETKKAREDAESEATRIGDARKAARKTAIESTLARLRAASLVGPDGKPVDVPTADKNESPSPIAHAPGADVPRLDPASTSTDVMSATSDPKPMGASKKSSTPSEK